tara:strand:+ start:699 stop:956 length:258 start_codon:yes stop_codon:yes gene_type:complete
MTDLMEKYVAKALEGYEQNYEGITAAIQQMESQLMDYKVKQQEMADGIEEMKDILGLDGEGSFDEKDGEATQDTLPFKKPVLDKA